VSRLAALIDCGPSDPRAIVCVDRGVRLAWHDLAARRATVAAGLCSGAAREPVLATSDPFDFLAALLACWQIGVDPVVPPNFQPVTLAGLARGGRVLIDDAWLAVDRR
jgi:hypothetical protein